MFLLCSTTTCTTNSAHTYCTMNIDSHDLDLVTGSHDLVTGSHDLVTSSHNLITSSHD